MKRITLLLLAISLMVTTASAETLTKQQLKARTEIVAALKKCATNISTEDEIIYFSTRGNRFLASVHSATDNVLFLTIGWGTGLDAKQYVAEVVNKAALDAALNMPVIPNYNAETGLLIFDCEMYALSAKPFIDVLQNMIDALCKSANGFSAEYTKALADYQQKQQATATVGSTQGEYLYPSIGSTQRDKRLYITRATLGDKYTILDMMSFNGGQYTWCAIAKDAYLTAGGKRYKLVKAEDIAYSPNTTDYPNWESKRNVCLSFRLYFEPMPATTTTFDFTESATSEWNMKDIQLARGKVTPVSGEAITTDAHRWECKSVEVRDGVTIVTKVVTPITDSTYMYNAQDEFIEDAATGRRYYLKTGSLGVAASPHITNDRQPITFYEVYPALPSTVTTININNGQYYYARGVRIR